MHSSWFLSDFWSQQRSKRGQEKLKKRPEMLRSLLRIIDGVDTEGIDAQLGEPVQRDMFSEVIKLGCTPAYSAMSRLQVLVSASGSTGSDEPPGW